MNKDYLNFGQLLKGALAILLLMPLGIFAQQPQQHVLYLKDKAVDLSVDPPVSTPLPYAGSPSSIYNHVSNGVHDSEGNLLFYLEGEQVVNRYGNVIGVFNFGTSGHPTAPEIAIVPVHGEPCQFYIIYTSYVGSFASEPPCNMTTDEDKMNTKYAIVDMAANNGLGAVVADNISINVCSEGMGAVIAVSPMNPSGDRFLYRIHFRPWDEVSTLHKHVIDGNGIGSSVGSWVLNLPGSYTTYELDMSHDGTMLAFSKGSPFFNAPDVVVLHLDANGNLDLSAGNQNNGQSHYEVFNGSGEFPSVEFTKNDQFIYTSETTDKIYRINVSTGAVEGIQFSEEYAASQLELGFDSNGEHRIYASDGVSLGRVNFPESPNPVMELNAVPGVSTNIVLWAGGPDQVYALPDQIDGYNYLEHYNQPIDPECCIGLAGYNTLSYEHDVPSSTETLWQGNNNPWNSQTVRIEGEFRVAAGSNLRIQGMEMQFGEDGKIVVEPSAKLVIDNTHLTSIDCGERWEGVYVGGVSSASQSVNYSAFGKIFLRNNSMVSNADGALNNFLYNSNGLDWNSIGGIIRASKTTFLNNWRSGQFLAYYNHNSSGNLVPDKSYFKECSFTVNDDLMGGFNAHVTQWKTHGVDFFGCSFADERTGIAINQKGKGIYTISASYRVRDYCTGINSYPCPQANILHSSFTGLYYGIESSGNIGSMSRTEVHDAIFTGNGIGIYGGVLSDFEVNNSTFNIENVGTVLFPSGIFLEETPNHRITENTFTSPSVIDWSVGMFSRNLGMRSDWISNNLFERMKIGCFSLGANRGGNVTGLEYRCNEYHDCDYAIAVIPWATNSLPQGIAKYQGSWGDGAGNEFYNNGFDIFNTAEDIVYTYPTSSAAEYIPSNSSLSVTLHPQDAALDCELPSDGGGHEFVKIADLLAEANNKYEELKNLEDGGDKEGLINTVKLSGPGEELELTQELLSKSPNLSEEVVKEAASKTNPLPEVMLKEIAAANPQAGKDKEVKEKTESLPEEMKEEIEESKYAVSPKELLESELTEKVHALYSYALDVYEVFMFDTIRYNPDSAKLVLAQLEDFESSLNMMQLASAVSNSTDLDDAFSIALSRVKAGSEEEQITQSLYSTYQLVMEKETTVSDWMNDPELVSHLQSIEWNEGRDGVYARNHLNWIGVSNHERSIPELVVSNARLAAPNSRIEQERSSVSPNPASDFISVKSQPGTSFELLNSQGKVVLTDKLTSTYSLVDLSGITGGFYSYRIMRNGKVVESGKLSVAK